MVQYASIRSWLIHSKNPGLRSCVTSSFFLTSSEVSFFAWTTRTSFTSTKHQKIWVCLKMLYTPKPNGFADHYPYEKWLFHWEYTQHFQTNPHHEKTDGFRSRDFRTDHPGISQCLCPTVSIVMYCLVQKAAKCLPDSPSLLCTLLCCSFPLQSLAFSLLHRALQPLHL